MVGWACAAGVGAQTGSGEERKMEVVDITAWLAGKIRQEKARQGTAWHGMEMEMDLENLSTPKYQNPKNKDQWPDTDRLPKSIPTVIRLPREVSFVSNLGWRWLGRRRSKVTEHGEFLELKFVDSPHSPELPASLLYPPSAATDLCFPPINGTKSNPASHDKFHSFFLVRTSNPTTPIVLFFSEHTPYG